MALDVKIYQLFIALIKGPLANYFEFVDILEEKWYIY